VFRGFGQLGKEGIIAEHPTLTLKYVDEEMARLADELKEKLDMQRNGVDGEVTGEIKQGDNPEDE
jgi:hypothetical protein